MKFVINNLYARAEGPPREMTTLRDLLAVDIEGAEFSDQYRKGFWDGKHKFMSPTSNALPSGLVPWVTERLEKKGYTVEVEDNRKRPSIAGDWSPLLGGIESRDYQEDLAKLAVEVGQGILHCATNAGKTEMAAMIIKAIDRPTLILVHRVSLLKQTVERLEARLGCKVGKITSDEVDLQDITVAMVPTLVKKLKQAWCVEYMKQLDVVIGDECHHASADTWMECLKACKHAFYRYGLSGTPFKDLLSNLKLMSVTGGVIGRVTNKFLIDNGYSAKPTVYVVEYDFKYDHYDWLTAYEQDIVYGEARNAVIAYLATQCAENGLPTLITVNWRDQGEILREAIDSMGVACDFLHGDHSVDQRSEAKQRLTSGAISVLIATTIFDEGEDVPDIRALFLAGGSRSEIANLQRIGRGLRRKAEDNTLIVFDIFDNCNKYLQNHSEDRIAIFLSEGFDVEVLDNVPRVS